MPVGWTDRGDAFGGCDDIGLVKLMTISGSPHGTAIIASIVIRKWGLECLIPNPAMAIFGVLNQPTALARDGDPAREDTGVRGRVSRQPWRITTSADPTQGGRI